MSQVRHKRFLPSPEEVLELLEAARDGAEDQFDVPRYSYIHKALHSVYTQSIVEISENEGNPAEILIESLQDERSVLDRHNRKEAKALFKYEAINELSEELGNFPLRFLATHQGIELPSWGVDPIFQTNDHSDVMAAACEARASAVTEVKVEGFSMPSASSKDKLNDAPSPEHDLPNGNVTLVELAAFIPQSIKCWDVIDRIMWNGAKTQDITNLINKYRLMPAGKIVNNSVYMMMRGQMDKRSKVDADYKDWTVGAHRDIEVSDHYDADSLSVTGFRRPTIYRDRPDEPARLIPFKDLARGVAMWPEHGDALDLTRIVKWCASNPDEEYYYPTDFQKVLQECLGGPVTPQARHTDAEVLSRLRAGSDDSKPRYRTKMIFKDSATDEFSTDDSEEGDNHQLGKRKRSSRSPRQINKRGRLGQGSAATDSHSTHVPRKANGRGVSRKNFTCGDLGSDDDTDDDAYQGPKRMKKKMDAPRRSKRNLISKVSYASDEMQFDEEESETEDWVPDQD